MEAKWVKDRGESVKGIRKINRWWDRWQEVPVGRSLPRGPGAQVNRLGASAEHQRRARFLLEQEGEEDFGGKVEETEVCRWSNASIRRHGERVSQDGGG